MPTINKKKSGRSGQSHVYLGLRDNLTTPQAGSTPPTTVLDLLTNSSGSLSVGVVFTPLGLTSTGLGASSYTQGGTGNVLAPNLRGLFSKAADFQMYRVTRARLVFITGVSSNTTGSITLSGYTDPFDIANTSSAITVSSVNTKAFPLSQAAVKNPSIPIPVDSSWKKVSSILNVPGNVFPFNGANAGLLVNVNTVSDLSFGAVFIRILGAPSSTSVGTCYLDYDVEFKNPIDSGVNL
jgi:hypothetical protein